MDIQKLVDDAVTFQAFVSLENRIRAVETESVKIRGILQNMEAQRQADLVVTQALPAGPEKTAALALNVVTRDTLINLSASWDLRFKVRP